MAVEVATVPTLTVGQPEWLFAGGDYLLDLYGSAAYDVTPDGRFLMVKEGAEESTRSTREVIAVTSWFEELTQRVPLD